MTMLFQLRSELWKMLGKKRTYIGFGAFFVAQAVMTLMIRFGPPRRGMSRDMARAGVDAHQYATYLTIATIVLLLIAYIMVPLYVALVGGDLVAKEVEDGTLRMILSRPISRVRLLLLKWTSGVVFSIALVTAFGLFGALFARLFFPDGALFVMGNRMSGGGGPGMIEAGAGLQHYAMAHAALILKAATVMTLAFMLSCFNMKPAAAMILAISVVFISWMVQSIPYLEDIQGWFFTYHLNLWTKFLQTTIPWDQVGKSVAVLAGYNLAFLVIGCWVFQRRDIKS